MDLVKRAYIKMMARLGMLEDYQIFFLASALEFYDEHYDTKMEPDWEFDAFEDGRSSFQELQGILKIYFENNIPREVCLKEMFELERYKAVSLYLSCLEKRKHHMTSMEQKKIVRLPYQYFSLLKCKLDDEYVEQLLDEGDYNKLDFYLGNFLLPNHLEKRLVILARNTEYRELLRKYIQTSMSEGWKVFDFGEAQQELVNSADTKSLLTYLNFCSIDEEHLSSQSILDLFKRPHDGNTLIVKYLEKSCIRDNDVFEKIYLNSESQLLKDMLNISNLRLYLFNLECFFGLDFKMKRGIGIIEKQLVDQYEEEIIQGNSNVICHKIMKRLRSGCVSPDMAAWCAANIHGVSTLALSALIRFSQRSMVECGKKCVGKKVTVF